MVAGFFVRALLVGSAFVFGALAPSCGGGGNDGPTGGLVATFTPASPTPAALSVGMQAGSVSGQNFSVRIAATDVPDFFGTAFTVSLPTGVSFVSMNTTQSFLRDGSFPAGSLSFLTDTTTAGRLRVVATRLNAGTNAGVNVTGTRELLTLTFRVSAALAATPMTFLAPPDATREVRNSVQPPPEGGLINVSWSGGSVAASQ